MLVAVLTVSVCFTTAASASDRPYFLSDIQHIGNLQQLSATVPFAIGASLHGNSALPLQQPTRMEIYNCIKQNPGVHFRGICDSLGLSVGVVQYHLDVLVHAGLIATYMDGQNKRFFENGAYTQRQMELISLAKHEANGKILTILSETGPALHKDIARCLGISPQALSWHMNQLKRAEVVYPEKTGINVNYNLVDPKVVVYILDRALVNYLSKA